VVKCDFLSKAIDEEVKRKTNYKILNTNNPRSYKTTMSVKVRYYVKEEAKKAAKENQITLRRFIEAAIDNIH
jgi:predicted HicB family RNase H-like nuclease